MNNHQFNNVVGENEIILVPVSSNLEDWPVNLLLAGQIFGEARNQNDTAKIGVAFVVLNRVEKGGWFGKSHKKVMLKPYQFSCFNERDVNLKKILNPLKYTKPEIWIRCYKIAQRILEGGFLDPTGGATHYFDKSMKDNPPYWAKSLVATTKIGDFYFYRQVK